jgi:hypothetical protein
VDCVLVNARGTKLLARELSVVVPYAIGMRQPVRDKSSIRFSAGFYQALAAGKSIEEVFQLGVTMLKMTPIGSDAGAPVLFRRDLPSEACPGRHKNRLCARTPGLACRQSVLPGRVELVSGSRPPTAIPASRGAAEMVCRLLLWTMPVGIHLGDVLGTALAALCL